MNIDVKNLALYYTNMSTIKIVCGVTEPTKKQRRGSMKECATRKQIRYYGIKKVDSITLSNMTSNKKKYGYTLSEAVGKASALRTRAGKVKKFIASATRKGNDANVKKFQDEYAEIKKQYVKLVPIVNKLMEEDDKKRADEEALNKAFLKKQQEKEKEKEKTKEKSKKTSRKTSKKSTKK